VEKMIVEKGYIYLLEKVSYIFIGIVVLLLSVFGLLYTILHFSDIISGYSIFSPIIMLSISALTLIVGIYIIKLGIERQRFKITHKAICPHYKIYGKSFASWNEIIIFAEIFMPSGKMENRELSYLLLLYPLQKRKKIIYDIIPVSNLKNYTQHRKEIPIKVSILTIKNPTKMYMEIDRYLMKKGIDLTQIKVV